MVIDFKLYGRDLASSTFLEELTGRVKRPVFSTKLNGGFGMFTAQIAADIPDAWDWITDKGLCRLVIAEKTKTLWEGRIQEPWFSQGAAGFTAYGYWASMRDQPYATAYNDHADDVIKAALTAVCPSISSDQSHIEATDITVTSAADASYLDITTQELVEKLLAFSDSTAAKWYFAIWENRIPWLFKRTLSTSHWKVSIRNGDLVDFKPRYDFGQWYSRVYARYQSGGSLTRTADAGDTDVETKYGGLTRKYAIPDLGAVAAAAAQAQRDAFLADRKYVRPTMDRFVLGAWVTDANGIRYPSSWVRAGQVIRIVDLVPVTSDLDAVTQDSFRTFYILETEYDVESRTNSLMVDTESQKLNAILARKL